VGFFLGSQRGGELNMLQGAFWTVGHCNYFQIGWVLLQLQSKGL